MNSYLNQIDTCLKAVEHNWPQYHIDGTRNIWILKPGAKSRGRGLLLSSFTLHFCTDTPAEIFFERGIDGCRRPFSAIKNCSTCILFRYLNLSKGSPMFRILHTTHHNTSKGKKSFLVDSKICFFPLLFTSFR